MITRIPTYRAKTIKQNFTKKEYRKDKSLVKINGIFYIIGVVVSFCNQIESITNGVIYSYEKETLSINFQGMKGTDNKPIFASLSEDGKGGDICYIAGKGLCYITFDLDGAYANIIENNLNIFDDLFPLREALYENDIKQVTGIQQ